MDLNTLILSAVIGLGATLILDVWGFALQRVFRIPASNYCLVGRWFLYMLDGLYWHDAIGRAKQKPDECVVGWTAHYVIGALYGWLFVMLVSPRWLIAPSLLSAVVFGLVTVVVPFFVMQPAFGLGIAASRAADPMETRIRSLMNHAVFGAGLYVSAIVLNYLVPMYA